MKRGGKGPLRRWGVRARVTTAASGVLVVVMVMGATLLVTLVNNSLVNNLDTAGLTRAKDVAAVLNSTGLGATVPASGEDRSLVQVVDRSGTVVSSSANIAGEPPIVITAPSLRETVIVTIDSVPVGGSAQPFRVVAEPVHLSSGDGWVYVASSLEQVASAVHSLILLLSIGLPIMLLIVGGTVWFAVGRALRPVESIRKRAVEIGADLTQRVPVPESNDEIGRLATTVNEMLDRLAGFSEQQRRFIGDASHELRSPLAAIRSQVDVALEHPLALDPLITLRTVQGQIEQMTQLLEDLLLLARVSEQPLSEDVATVDLDEVVVRELRRLQLIKGSKQVRLAHLDAVRTAGSARDLGRLIANLGDNALRYAASEVTLALNSRHDGTAAIVITDDGPGIPPADRERIFGRFTRLDDSRARSVEHVSTGLGLAIAAQIAHRHGGTIRAGVRHDHHSGAVMTVILPAASDVRRRPDAPRSSSDARQDT